MSDPRALPRLKGSPRYELHHDQIEETFTIRMVQDIGPFESRQAARQYMLDTMEERKAESAGV